MNLKPLLSTIAALLLSLSTFGQKYDLNTYKFRYQHYKSLELNYSLNGWNQSSNYDSMGYNKYKYLVLGFGLAKNKFQNTEKKQRTEQFSVSFDIKPTNSISNGVLFQNDFFRSNLKLGNQLNYSNDSKYYYKKNWFVHTIYNGNLNTYIDRVKLIDTARTIKNKRGLNTNQEISIGFGKGRIEVIDDAVTALYLLKDLTGNKLIGSFTNEQVENLAKEITFLRNRRYIGDFRFNYIDQISAIDSTCKANGIGQGNNSPKFFSLLYDNLYFANYLRRKVGFVISNAPFFNGRVRLDNDKTTSNDNTYYEKYGTDFGYRATVQGYKQIKDNLQREFTAELELRKMHIDYSKQTDNKEKGHNFYISANYGYLFQPNSRTSFTMSIGASFIDSKTVDYSQSEYNYSSLNFHGDIRFNKFISRKIILFGNLSNSKSYYLKNDSKIQKRKNDANLYLDSGLRYILY